MKNRFLNGLLASAAMTVGAYGQQAPSPDAQPANDVSLVATTNVVDAAAPVETVDPVQTTFNGSSDTGYLTVLGDNAYVIYGGQVGQVLGFTKAGLEAEVNETVSGQQEFYSQNLYERVFGTNNYAAPDVKVMPTDEALLILEQINGLLNNASAIEAGAVYTFSQSRADIMAGDEAGVFTFVNMEGIKNPGVDVNGQSKANTGLASTITAMTPQPAAPEATADANINTNATAESPAQPTQTDDLDLLTNTLSGQTAAAQNAAPAQTVTTPDNSADAATTNNNDPTVITSAKQMTDFMTGGKGMDPDANKAPVADNQAPVQAVEQFDDVPATSATAPAAKSGTADDLVRMMTGKSIEQIAAEQQQANAAQNQAAAPATAPVTADNAVQPQQQMVSTINVIDPAAANVADAQTQVADAPAVPAAPTAQDVFKGGNKGFAVVTDNGQLLVFYGNQVGEVQGYTAEGLGQEVLETRTDTQQFYKLGLFEGTNYAAPDVTILDGSARDAAIQSALVTVKDFSATITEFKGMDGVYQAEGDDAAALGKGVLYTFSLNPSDILVTEQPNVWTFAGMSDINMPENNADRMIAAFANSEQTLLAMQGKSAGNDGTVVASATPVQAPAENDSSAPFTNSTISAEALQALANTANNGNNTAVSQPQTNAQDVDLSTPATAPVGTMDGLTVSMQAISALSNGGVSTPAAQNDGNTQADAQQDGNMLPPIPVATNSADTLVPVPPVTVDQGQANTTATPAANAGGASNGSATDVDLSSDQTSGSAQANTKAADTANAPVTPAAVDANAAKPAPAPLQDQAAAPQSDQEKPVVTAESKTATWVKVALGALGITALVGVITGARKSSKIKELEAKIALLEAQNPRLEATIALLAERAGITPAQIEAKQAELANGSAAPATRSTGSRPTTAVASVVGMTAIAAASSMVPPQQAEASTVNVAPVQAEAPVAQQAQSVPANNNYGNSYIVGAGIEGYLEATKVAGYYTLVRSNSR